MQRAAERIGKVLRNSDIFGRNSLDFKRAALRDAIHPGKRQPLLRAAELIQLMENNSPKVYARQVEREIEDRLYLYRSLLADYNAAHDAVAALRKKIEESKKYIRLANAARGETQTAAFLKKKKFIQTVGPAFARTETTEQQTLQRAEKRKDRVALEVKDLEEAYIERWGLKPGLEKLVPRIHGDAYEGTRAAEQGGYLPSKLQRSGRLSSISSASLASSIVSSLRSRSPSKTSNDSSNGRRKKEAGMMRVAAMAAKLEQQLRALQKGKIAKRQSAIVSDFDLPVRKKSFSKKSRRKQNNQPFPQKRRTRTTRRVSSSHQTSSQTSKSNSWAKKHSLKQKCDRSYPWDYDTLCVDETKGVRLSPLKCAWKRAMALRMNQACKEDAKTKWGPNELCNDDRFRGLFEKFAMKDYKGVDPYKCNRVGEKPRRRRKRKSAQSSSSSTDGSFDFEEYRKPCMRQFPIKFDYVCTNAQGKPLPLDVCLFKMAENMERVNRCVAGRGKTRVGEVCTSPETMKLYNELLVNYHNAQTIQGFKALGVHGWPKEKFRTPGLRAHYKRQTEPPIKCTKPKAPEAKNQRAARNKA
jgi:hypothetical protein